MARTLESHKSGVLALMVTQDGTRTISASQDKVKVWDMESGEVLSSRDGIVLSSRDWKADKLLSATVSPDGIRALSNFGSAIKVWDLERGKDIGEAVFTLIGHPYAINSLALTPDGSRAVSASADKTLKVWNLIDGEELCTLRGHSSEVKSVAVTPDGSRAISCSIPDSSRSIPHLNSVKVWDLETGEQVCALVGHTEEVVAVAITPDGNKGLSVSNDRLSDFGDRMLILWNLENGEALRIIKSYSGYIQAVALPPDGNIAICGSRDGTLEVWDLISGVEMATFKFSSAINSCTIAPGGLTIVAGDEGGRVHFLHLENYYSAAPISSSLKETY